MGEYHSPLPNDTKMKKLSNILKNLAYSEIIGNENIEISGVQFDSRIKRNRFSKPVTFFLFETRFIIWSIARFLQNRIKVLSLQLQ